MRDSYELEQSKIEVLIHGLQSISSKFNIISKSDFYQNRNTGDKRKYILLFENEPVVNCSMNFTELFFCCQGIRLMNKFYTNK